MADLFDRCDAAYDATYSHEDGLAAVLRTIAAEILEHNHRGSAREIAQMLLMAADNGPTEPEEQDEEPPETWPSHPSLTVQQRNPTLR
jgi:hypothetical protein